MARNLTLNTACRAFFKDGSIKEFKSIEEASKDTGLTINSIKFRCNRKGCVGKDKTAFEWIDDHTKRHFRAKKNKHKGNNLEVEICNKLKEIGYSGCVTSRSESKSMDDNKIDIIDKEDKLPVYIQSKYLANTPSYFTIRDECPLKDKPFCIIWKKSAPAGSVSPGAIAMVDLNFFYRLLKKYNE